MCVCIHTHTHTYTHYWVSKVSSWDLALEVEGYLYPDHKNFARLFTLTPSTAILSYALCWLSAATEPLRKQLLLTNWNLFTLQTTDHVKTGELSLTLYTKSSQLPWHHGLLLCGTWSTLHHSCDVIYLCLFFHSFIHSFNESCLTRFYCILNIM